MAINNQPTIKPRTVTGIFTKYIAKTIPLAFDESMSYYECLCALLEYINTKVVPALDNNAAGLLELQEFYEELQTYVNDYFKNLDVQEEINNKLDDMAESGQLTDIIAQYLGLAGMITFNNVAEMKVAENLVNGSKCCTLGYYNVNDGGKSFYKIRTITNEDVVDEMFIIALYDNSLIAELIIENEINVLQLGAKGDYNQSDQTGTDNTNILQNAINKGIELKKNIYIPSGNYLINNKIEIETNDGLTIYGDHQKYTYTNTTLVFNTLISFELITPISNFVMKDMNIVNILSQSTNNTKLINITGNNGYLARSTFKNLNIANYYDALNLTSGGNDYNDGMIIENVQFRTVGRCITAKHIEASRIVNCYAEPFTKYFAYIDQQGGVEISNCIFRSVSTQATNSVAIVTTGNPTYGRNLTLRNCICEDVDCFALIGTPNSIIENNRYIINRTPNVSPIMIGLVNGTNANNTRIKNFVVTYEDETTTTPNVELINGSGTFTNGGLSIPFGALNSSNTYLLGTKLSYTGSNQFRRVIQNDNYTIYGYNNLRVFLGNNDTTLETNRPDGSSWNYGDIVLFNTSPSGANRFNTIFGKVYTQSGWYPIFIGCASMTTTQANTYGGYETGQMNFNKTSNKPMWWNGTNWVYADGTTIS